MTPIIDTLSPLALLRCSGCGLRWTAATLDPRSLSRVWPAGGDRPGAAVRCQHDVTPGKALLPPSSNRSPGPEPRRPTTSARPGMSPMSPRRVTRPLRGSRRDSAPGPPRISRSDRAWQISTITRHERDTTPTDRGPRRRVIPQKRQENAPTLRKNMGQCMRDSNRAMARHLHQDVYRDRHRDTLRLNGALAGAYSGTGAGNATLSYRKIPGQWKQCESNSPAAVPLEMRPGPPEISGPRQGAT